MKRPITPKGYRKLRDELLDCKSQRVEVARLIEVARGHGDLSENGDYDAAKNKSGLLEAKIRDLEVKLANAEVIDVSKLDIQDRIVFGVSCKLEEVDSGEEKVFSLVGEDESDLTKGLISYSSPIGKSLIGKNVGDIVTVITPGGKKEFEVMQVFIDQEEVR